MGCYEWFNKYIVTNYLLKINKYYLLILKKYLFIII